MALARRKFVLWLSLILVTVMGALVVGNQPAHAATLPTGAGYVNTNTTYYGTPQTGKELVPSTGTASGTLPAQVPTVTVAANNLSSNNRITYKTTKIYLIFSGTIAMATTGTTTMTSVVPTVFNNKGEEQATKTPSDLAPSSTKSIRFSNTTVYEVDVNFTSLEDFRLNMPLYYGLAVKSSNGTKANMLGLGESLLDNTINNTWLANGPFTLNATYSGKPTVYGTSALRADDTSVSGKLGYPGLHVWLPLTDSDGTLRVYTSTIAEDGTFTIEVGKELGLLTAKKNITVFEGNDMGDETFVGGSLMPVLKITATNPDLSVYPDSLSDNITGKSDEQVLAWIVQEAGVSVTRLGTTVDNADVTYSVDKTNLANALSGLGDGESLSLEINAKDNTGAITDGGGQTITITKHDGTLSFGTINDLNFGSQVIPAQTTMFSPVDPGVTIDDTRAAGSAWYVTANASPLTDGNGHAVSGGLVYVGTNGTKQPMTNQAVQVASGTRAKGVNSVDAASGWSKSDSQKQTGIYLDANANTYTGEQSTNYTGTVTWTLSNTP
ncbi:MAG TPA: hypothetical protein H9875_00830 [Candidatus Levilactobacillus faecigallinarum]|uniref:WxL domain-containing protein n=1 Tax=Candidatus Levilactobacillus faecigallinarum TaxID=2838638 RepID=A0A9D1U4R9_9LACO|nr:hypothetical protein [Candidatus Levilactobacillus faecigallinarum]